MHFGPSCGYGRCSNRPERGWGFHHGTAEAGDANDSDRLDDLLRRVQELEATARVAELPAKPERSETRAKRLDVLASTQPLETGVKRGAK
jgi:hypothetical protein